MTESSIVVGLGELLWDCFADSRRPGGAPANVAFHAGQLGCRGIVCSRVGADPLGDELVEFLKRQGLAADWVERDPAHPTGTVTVDTSRPDQPRFTIHEDVAWDHLHCGADLEQLMASAAAVCFGTLAQRCVDSRQAIQRALSATRPGALVVYDVNLRQHWYQRAWIEESLRKAQLVKLNHEEVRVLAGLLQTESQAPEAFARELQARFNVEAVCITRAEEGCLLVDGDAVVDSPGVKVEVVDAVGAGDAFTAAWIVARLSRWPPESQARFANRVGALVASRPGAMPPLGDALAAIRSEFT